FTFKKETIYYISPNDKNNFVVANAKNLNKFFSKKDISGYVTQNKLNLNKIENLIDVFVYASKP
ncbi:MAG: hypothetical protein ABI123_04505, partial [Ginsengibacter sp.]